MALAPRHCGVCDAALRQTLSDQALYDLMENPRFEQVQSKLTEGADPNITGSIGWTPLQMASVTVNLR
jgi:ankyrin repeat protein